MTIALNKSSTASFNNGVATAILQNGGLTNWHIKLMNVSTTSTSQTKCTVYQGDVSPANQRDFTRTGNGDTSPCDLTLRPGEKLTVQWVNGSAGGTAIITVNGTETRGY